MRKTITLSLILVLLTMLMLPYQAFAAYDKDLEKAIEKARSVFKISDGFDNFTYNINKQNEKTVFNLMWNDSKNRLGNIDVTVDSVGTITNYNSYKPFDSRNQQKLPVVSKSQGYQLAVDFIRKVTPGTLDKVKFVENNNPLNIADRSYQYVFVRLENGIPYPENGINVNVDSMSGEVRNFNYSWYEDVIFPDSTGVLTQEAAQTQYTDKLGLKLVYKLSFDQSNQVPYLAYLNVFNNRYLDAKTGEIVSFDNFYPYYYDNGRGMGGYGGMYSKAKEEKSLTPKEQAAVGNAANLMDQKKAEDTARNIMKIDSSFTLNNVSLYNNWQSQEDYTWSLDFSKEVKIDGNPQYSGVNISLDARTGDIVNFYRSVPSNSAATVKYTEEQAQKIAENFIKTVQPQRYLEVERTTWSQRLNPLDSKKQPGPYDFTFTRKVNVAYFIDNGFNLGVDNTSGIITNYSFNWYKKQLPTLGKIITLDEANKVLFEQVGIQKQFISEYSTDDKKIYMPNQQRKPELRLVYALKPEKLANVDAYTGKLLNDAGKPVEQGNASKYSDIKGCFAEKQISVMAEYGIYLPGTQLKPNTAITQREFLYLLEKGLNSYLSLTPDSSGDDNLYNELMAAGIVKEGERAPNTVVSRQDAVKFIVRALNYDKVADISKGIFKLPFKDAGEVKANLYGYFAVAYGLNIINGNNGYCHPTANLTKAQAFVILYNFLNVH